MLSGVNTPSLPMSGFLFLRQDLSSWHVLRRIGAGVHINEGLRFPLPMLVHQFFYHTRLHPIHTM